ncbi:MAG: DUF805 domain-containing protein [Succinivibrionaceae bacterium]|nr:DUF805 domain-containing protein [Succinivibrionaceae bacterium]
MNFLDAVKYCLTDGLINFKGRACRSEYWWFFLFSILVTITLGLLPDSVSIVARGASYVFFIAMLTAGSRRLHDLGHSGLWMIFYVIAYLVLAVASALILVYNDDNPPDILLLAIAGSLLVDLAFLVVFMRRGNPGPNRYGSDPLEDPVAAHAPPPFAFLRRRAENGGSGQGDGQPTGDGGPQKPATPPDPGLEVDLESLKDRKPDQK